jgi:ribonuclease BN (tRNA processing enzyme)
MKLIFLGVGSAFALQNFHSNMILEVNGKKLLIDAGGDIRHSLKAVGLSYKDIDAVYISHLHSDHVGGMEYLALATYFDPSCKKLPLFVNERLSSQLWNEVMKGGAGTLQNKIATLDTYFEVKSLPKNGQFTFEDVTFQTVQVVHYVDGYEIVPSYGLIWTAKNGKKIFLTTDTQFAPSQIQSYYDDADIIFQDCETAKFKSGVHAHYSELVTLKDEIKNKMWLYHYQDGNLPDCKKDGFLGFVKQGQEFDFGSDSFLLEEALAAIPHKA